MPIEHENLLRVLVKYVDFLGHRRVQMRDVRGLRNVGDDFLLNDLFRHFVVFTDLCALFHMVENALVFLDSLASWAGEEKHVEDLLHISVQFLRSLFAPASVYWTLPSQLHLDAVLTEEHVALGALLWIWFGYEFAQLADELIKSTGHP